MVQRLGAHLAGDTCALVPHTCMCLFVYVGRPTEGCVCVCVCVPVCGLACVGHVIPMHLYVCARVCVPVG